MPLLLYKIFDQVDFRRHHGIVLPLLLRQKKKKYPPIAQPVERQPFKLMVPGSIPGGRTSAKEKQ